MEVVPGLAGEIIGIEIPGPELVEGQFDLRTVIFEN